MFRQAQIPRIAFGLAAGTLTLAAGVIFFYWQKRKRQKAIEDNLKGTNRRKRKPGFLNGPHPVDVRYPDSKEKELMDKSRKAVMKEALQLNAEDSKTNVVNTQNGLTGEHTERSMNLEIRVSRDNVGSFIGKQGTNIRKLQKDTNTRIMQTGDVQLNGDRTFMISGTPEAVILADSKIKKHIMSQPVLGVAEMIVPEKILGKIIGRQGETIRTIQDVSLTRIDIPEQFTVPQEECDFTDENYDVPKRPTTRVIKIKGTEEQIAQAQRLISGIIEDESTLKKRISASLSKRTPRCDLKTKNTQPNGNITSNNGITDDNIKEETPAKNCGPNSRLYQGQALEALVSCVHSPNEFYFQISGSDTIALDNLCATMTSYYKTYGDNEKSKDFAVGDCVAAPFVSDTKMYRGRIDAIEGDEACVFYLDYGDTKQIKISNLRKLKLEYLRNRFQAIPGSLNLKCLSEQWSDEAIEATVRLTECANWIRLKAKVQGYSKDPLDLTRDIIILELYDSKNKSIGDTLIARGLAGSGDN